MTTTSMSLEDQLKALQALVKQDQDGDFGAHKQLLASIRTLQLSAETAEETNERLNWRGIHLVAIRISVEKGFLQAIAAASPNAISAEQIGNETKSDPLFVVRVMRLVVVIGLADEAGYQSYKANKKTLQKASKTGVSAEKHHFDYTYGMGGKLIPYLREGKLVQFVEKPVDESLFKYTYGHADMFTDFEHNAEQKEAFDVYMESTRDPRAPQWYDKYPAGERLTPPSDPENGVLLVDVGSGPGHEMIKLKEKVPGLKGKVVLQDRKSTLDGIKSLPSGIEAMEHDFFTPQPVEGARAYFMRRIMHDWSNETCTVILKHIVEAMDQDSVILIDDWVLPDRDSPLRPAELDFLMWFYANGMERSLGQWEALLSGAGLKIVKVWGPQGGAYENVIECQKA